MPKYDPTEKTKMEMLEVAVKIFRKKGWQSVNIEDVVKEVGVTRGAFYHYFKSREDFIYATLMQLLIEDNPYIEAMNKEGLNALQKIRFAFKKGIKHPYNTVLSNEELLKAAHDSVAFKCYIMFSLEVLAPYLEKLIIEGNKDGSINAQYPKHLAQAGILLFNEWLNLTAFNMSPHEFSERVLFLELLGKQTGIPVMDDELKEILMQNYETHRGK